MGEGSGASDAAATHSLLPEPAAVLDLLRRRRTARSHRTVPVPDAALESLLEAVRWAPSAANRQPWELVVVTDEVLKRELRDAYLAEANERDAHYRTVTERQANLLMAPVVIVVCGDSGAKGRFVDAAAIGEAAQEELFLLTMGAAIQNLLLAATASGLTTTWMARPSRVPRVRELLRVPAAIRVLALVALGVAGEEPRWRESFRAAIAGKTHLDRYGTVAAAP